MTERLRLKAAEKYVEAIGCLSPSDRQKLIDGVAVILGVLERTRKENK